MNDREFLQAVSDLTVNGSVCLDRITYVPQSEIRQYAEKFERLGLFERETNKSGQPKQVIMGPGDDPRSPRGEYLFYRVDKRMLSAAIGELGKKEGNSNKGA